jgi:hypothetical protein
MGSAQLKIIMPGVQVRTGKRGKSVRFACMINSKRFTQTCDLPADLLIDPKTGRPTRLLRQEYNKWVDECGLQAGTRSTSSLRTPTIAELIKHYESMAWERNRDPNHNKPSARSIETAIKNYRYCVEASGLRDSQPYTELMDVDMIRHIFKTFMESGMRGTSAYSYIISLQSVTAKWTLVIYRDRGFKVEQPLIPDFGKAKEAPSYQQLSPELDRKIDDWILALDENADPASLFYVVMMNNLAIRPNDMGKLTADNFPLSENGHRRFCYVPQKTKESSNRRVDIEIPDALWEQIYNLRKKRYDAGELLLPNWRYVETMVNASMRLVCGMPPEKYSKASYELRKRCLHRVMISQGIDVAVQLSGDRRDTLEKYYVDPYRAQAPLKLYQPPTAPAAQSPQ